MAEVGNRANRAGFPDGRGLGRAVVCGMWAARPGLLLFGPKGRVEGQKPREHIRSAPFTLSPQSDFHMFSFFIYIYIYMDKLTCINADTRSAEVFIVMGKTSTVYILICFSTHPDVHYELRNHIICLCF